MRIIRHTGMTTLIQSQDLFLTAGTALQATGTSVTSTSTRSESDYTDEATEQANYYHAEAMLSYFGPTGYNVLSDEEIAQYEAVTSAFGK